MLCVLLLICSLPAFCVSALESTGNAKFDSFINDSRFTNGVSWAGNLRPKLASFGGLGCCAYCADYVKYCFGTNGPQSGEVYYTISEIRAGDVISLGNPDDGTGHWLIVLKRTSEYCYVAEGSYENKVRIGWNYTISGDKFLQDRRPFTAGYHYLKAVPLPNIPEVTVSETNCLPGATVRIKWKETLNADSYRLHICKNGSDYFNQSMGKIMTWSGMLGGGTYEIYVEAVNTSGKTASKKTIVKCECKSHSFNAWALKKEAACTENGVKSRTCKICGYQESETLAALGHNFSDWVTIKAATGNTSGQQNRTCKRCNFTETKTISAFGTKIKLQMIDDVTVRISSLDEKNEIIRYAKGAFNSLNEIKNASGSKFFMPDGENSIDIYFPEKGTYTIGVSGADGKDEAIFSVKIKLTNTFFDVPAECWYTNAVLWCSKKGFMSGTASGHFSPMSNLTRAMFVQMLYAIEGSPEMVYIGAFDDVSAQSWYSSAVEWAYLNGITGGTSDDTFDPSGTVTREQLATFFYAYRQYKSGNVAFKSSDISKYIDKSRISGWALTSVNWAISQGILSGTSQTTLSPKTCTTRSQSAVVLYSYFNRDDG